MQSERPHVWTPSSHPRAPRLCSNRFTRNPCRTCIPLPWTCTYLLISHRAILFCMFWGVGKIRGASTASLLPGPSCCADAAAIGESEHWTKRVRARGVKQRRAGIKNLSCFGKMWKTEQNEFGKYEICMLRVSNKFKTCFFAPWSLVCLSGKYSSNYCLWWHHPVQYYLASGVCCYMIYVYSRSWCWKWDDGINKGTSSIKGVPWHHHATGNHDIMTPSPGWEKPRSELIFQQVRKRVERWGHQRGGSLVFGCFGSVHKIHKKTTIWRPCMLAAICFAIFFCNAKQHYMYTPWN